MHPLCPRARTLQPCLSVRDKVVRSMPSSPTQTGSLEPLFSPLTTLSGVGPERASMFERAIGGTRIVDLLFHDLPFEILE